MKKIKLSLVIFIVFCVNVFAQSTYKPANVPPQALVSPYEQGSPEDVVHKVFTYWQHGHWRGQENSDFPYSLYVDSWEVQQPSWVTGVMRGFKVLPPPDRSERTRRVHGQSGVALVRVEVEMLTVSLSWPQNANMDKDGGWSGLDIFDQKIQAFVRHQDTDRDHAALRKLILSLGKFYPTYAPAGVGEVVIDPEKRRWRFRILLTRNDGEDWKISDPITQYLGLDSVVRQLKYYVQLKPLRQVCAEHPPTTDGDTMDRSVCNEETYQSSIKNRVEDAKKIKFYEQFRLKAKP